jgi:hypothetical protein
LSFFRLPGTFRMNIIGLYGLQQEMESQKWSESLRS